MLKKILRKFEKLKFVQNYFANHFFYEGYQKNVRNEEIRACFKSRQVEREISDAEINRIIKAYQKTILEEAFKSEIFSVGNEWLPIYQNHMKDVIGLLKTGETDKLKAMYQNFMRESCSVGIHGMPVDMEKTYFSKTTPQKLHSKMYINDSNYRYDFWKSSMGLHIDDSNLYMPEFGNSYGYFKNNIYIRTGAEYLHYYAMSIKNLLITSAPKKNTILEIGGGYGGLAYFLNKSIPELTYIDLDLPENMALTAYYMLCCFPDKKILFYGEDSLDNIHKYDIAILPNFCIDYIKDNTADLVFNSYSFAEMAPETINYYIKKIKKISKNYILHVNHSYKSSSLNADNFGIDKDGIFTLISRSKAMWAMYRNYRSDEYEYLYKKIKDN